MAVLGVLIFTWSFLGLRQMVSVSLWAQMTLASSNATSQESMTWPRPSGFKRCSQMSNHLSSTDQQTMQSNAQLDNCTPHLDPFVQSSQHPTAQSNQWLSLALWNAHSDCDIIALGDFNAPDIDWSTLTGTTNYSHSLCNAVYNKNLTQIIITPTHKQGNTLDLILTNSPSRIINLNIQTSPSDHYMITADLLTHTSQCSKHNLKSSKFLYSRGDYESMDDFLYQTTNTSEFQQILDTDAAWNELKSTISRACEIFIPKITPLKTYPKWFDASIRHKLNCVHTIRRQSRKNPSNTILVRTRFLIVTKDLVRSMTSTGRAFQRWTILEV